LVPKTESEIKTDVQKLFELALDLKEQVDKSEASYLVTFIRENRAANREAR
jgi:hypothetical protein